jgi:hypothetical protein
LYHSRGAALRFTILNELPMAWKIASWSAEKGEGTVVSPHFGPLPFDSAQTVPGKTDFALGEEVVVELTGPSDAFTIHKVIAIRKSQPAAPQDPVFEALNAKRHGEFLIEDDEEHLLRVWVGDCCAWCGPFAEVTFRQKATVVYPERYDRDEPWFRRASLGEIEALAHDVPTDHQVYCIDTRYSNGRHAQSIYVVAREVEVTFHPRLRE